MNGETESSKNLHAHAFDGTTRDVTVWTTLLIYQLWTTLEMSQCVDSCEGTRVRRDWPPVVLCVTRWMHSLAIVPPLSYYVVSSHRYEETGDGLKCIGPLGEWKRGKYGRLSHWRNCLRSSSWVAEQRYYLYLLYWGYIYTYMKINRFSYIKKFFLQFSYEKGNVRSCPNARGNFGHPYNSL